MAPSAGCLVGDQILDREDDLYRCGSCTKLAMTVVTTLWMASASGGVPSRAGEEQVPGADQGGCERVDVSIGRDAAQVVLGGEV